MGDRENWITEDDSNQRKKESLRDKIGRGVRNTILGLGGLVLIAGMVEGMSSMFSRGLKDYTGEWNPKQAPLDWKWCRDVYPETLLTYNGRKYFLSPNGIFYYNHLEGERGVVVDTPPLNKGQVVVRGYKGRWHPMIIDKNRLLLVDYDELGNPISPYDNYLEPKKDLILYQGEKNLTKFDISDNITAFKDSEILSIEGVELR